MPIKNKALQFLAKYLIIIGIDAILTDVTKQNYLHAHIYIDAFCLVVIAEIISYINKKKKSTEVDPHRKESF